MVARIALALGTLVAVSACPLAPAEDGGANPGDGGRDAAIGVDRAAPADAADVAADHTISVDAARAASCARDSWIAVVNGRLIDESGAGLANAVAQLCVRTSGTTSQLVCVRPVDTEPDGRFAIVVPPSARCMLRATMRALLPGGATAASYCEVTLTGQEGVLTLADPIVVAATRAATSLPALGDAAQARTVVFDDGLEVEVVPERYFGSDYSALAGRRVDPTTTALCFIADPGEYSGIYAFAPEGDIQGTGFALRIPNSTAIAASTAIDLFVLGGLSCRLADGSLVREGLWARFGGGAVSSDGTVIEASGASGLPCFNWLAYKPAP